LLSGNDGNILDVLTVQKKLMILTDPAPKAHGIPLFVSQKIPFINLSIYVAFTCKEELLIVY
jgi:hypothetical protein